MAIEYVRPYVKVFTNNSLTPTLFDNVTRLELVIDNKTYNLIPLGNGWLEVNSIPIKDEKLNDKHILIMWTE